MELEKKIQALESDMKCLKETILKVLENGGNKEMEKTDNKKILQKINITQYIGNIHVMGGSWVMYTTDMEIEKIYIEPKPMYCEETNTVTWEECKVETFDEYSRSVFSLEPFDHIPLIVCNDFDKVIEKKGYKVIEF